jgi:hypothetical protein
MTGTTAYQKRHAKARQRRRHTAAERLQRDHAQAQRAIEALEQALHDVGLPDHLVTELEGRLRRQQRLLGKIFGVMFPSLFGCRTPSELARVRGWDKNLPPQILGALPKRSWLKRLRRLGLEVLIPLWRHVQDKSPATRSRWQWTWVADDSVFKKYGEQLGLVGTWWSGQHKRVLSGIDGLLLVVVIGDGRLVVPVDFAIRRPNPTGPGAPCRDKLCWARTMLDARLVACARRGLQLPPPLVVADSWFSDSKLMQHVGHTHQGTLLVEGKHSYTFTLADGRWVKGLDLIEGEWPWQDQSVQGLVGLHRAPGRWPHRVSSSVPRRFGSALVRGCLLRLDRDGQPGIVPGHLARGIAPSNVLLSRPERPHLYDRCVREYRGAQVCWRCGYPLS